jgi:SAM-dependent methyltransferase
MIEPTLSSASAASNVIDEISPNDAMFAGGRVHYFKGAESGLRCVRLATAAAGKEEIGSILDLPCGHGRVLRMLKAAFPSAALTASDIDPDGVDFCASTFGATPVYASEEPDDIELEDSFDLIWCGSLLTHLDAPRFTGFLSLFERLLAREGLLVFTTCGPHVVDGLRKRKLKRDLGLGEAARKAALADYERGGFGFAPYLADTDYGISLASPGWVCAQLAALPSLRLVSYVERGFGARGLQDAIACLRVPDATS